MTVIPTARYPTSRWRLRSHRRQGKRFGGGRSRSGFATTSGIALLLPRVAVVVISARLPIAGLVPRGEPDARQPLRALPEVEVGHDRAHGRSVRARERPVVETVR